MILSPTERDEVQRLLDRQHELFRTLDAMSQRQSLLIAEGQTEALLEVLGERQGVIDGIAETNAFLTPYRARWEQVLSSFEGAARESVRKKIDAMSALAEAVAKRDEADRLELERRRQAISVEMTQVQRGRGAMAAYGGSKSTTPTFSDREA